MVVGAAALVVVTTAVWGEEGQPPFSIAKYRKSLGHGPGRVVGRLAVDVPGRGTIVQGGVVITLLPAQGFTDWWMHRADAAIGEQRGPIHDPPLDARLTPFRRVAATDRSGYFTFNDLPAGSYVARGRLSVAFPRIKVVRHDIAVATVGGKRVVQPVTEEKKLTDYTYVFLATDILRVTRGPALGVRFHVTARRNVLATSD